MNVPAPRPVKSTRGYSADLGFRLGTGVFAVALVLIVVAIGFELTRQSMAAIQAVLRSQLQSAAGGNVRAQRDILAMIRDIEVIRSVVFRCDDGDADDVVDDTDDADAIGSYAGPAL